MSSGLYLSLAATLFLSMATIVALSPQLNRPRIFWFNVGPAAAWAVAAALFGVGRHWSAALSADLWVAVAASSVLFLVVSLIYREARRLTVLIMPYLLLLAILATISQTQEQLGVSEDAPPVWVGAHILVSVTTLGLLTLAAAAALACFIQARALKLKRPNGLSRLLPAVSESERLYERLLILSEIVLAAGVATGMATEFAETGRLLIIDHKTLFSLLAFALIGGLIAGRRWGGVRGQIAVRLLLVAYSFVLLGYFGVKFVKQVLLS